MKAPRLMPFRDDRFKAKDFYTKFMTQIDFVSEAITKTFTHTEGQFWTSEDTSVAGEMAKFINRAGFMYNIADAELVLHVNDPYMINPRLINVPRTFRYRLIYNPDVFVYKQTNGTTNYVCRLSVIPIEEAKAMWECDIF